MEQQHCPQDGEHQDSLVKAQIVASPLRKLDRENEI